MNVEINWLAVVLAAASSMVVGSIWYAKAVFGKTWQKLVGMDDKKMKSGAGPAMGMAVVASFITAYILAHVAFLSHNFFNHSFLQDSVMTAFWLWLGISATTIIVHDAFEQRPSQLTLMNIGNQFATLMVMGIIIGYLKP